MDEAVVPVIDGFADLVEIGVGGFSVVYRARQLGLERSVAIKVINATGSEGRRFEREARALGSLSDIAHVVGTYQVTTTADGRPAIVMQLLPFSLGGVLRADGPVHPRYVRRWALQLASALDRAHGLGIAHRDIKPENVLLSEDGDAYLMDFGIAAIHDLPSATTTSLSMSPPYAPPERFTGEETSTVAGDVYSLAATLYAALSGRAPFGTTAEGGTLGMMNRVANDPLPQLPEVGDDVNAAFARAMAKDPADRPATATEFADDLAAAIDGLANEAEATSTSVNDGLAHEEPSPTDATVIRSFDVSPTVIRAHSGTAAELPIDDNAHADRPRRRAGLRRGALVLLIATVAGGVVVWNSSDPDIDECNLNGSVEFRPAHDTAVLATGSVRLRGEMQCRVPEASTGSSTVFVAGTLDATLARSSSGGTSFNDYSGNGTISWSDDAPTALSIDLLNVDSFPILVMQTDGPTQFSPLASRTELERFSLSILDGTDLANLRLTDAKVEFTNG